MTTRHASCMPATCTPAAGDLCLRCQTTGDHPFPAGAALLLGAIDADSQATLQHVLDAQNVAYETRGPVLMLADIRERLACVETVLRTQLSHETQQALRAAYVPEGVETLEKVLAALVRAEPLPVLLARLEQEWARKALQSDCLFSVFHPIVDAHSGQVFAYEALLRSRHPETGQVIGAGPIIQACTELNLQHQLDQQARKAAIRGAAALGRADVRYFINFLPNTIYDPRICLQTTIETAQECGLELNRLVFEVVETEQIPDMPRLQRILDYYRSHGVGTAVDDMGAGHTSMRYLTALRPDFVKMDRDTVVKAEHDARSRREFMEIVAQAGDLGCRVIAEGIETPAQMQVCLDAGVDFLQGFLFARPANPPQDVAQTYFIPLAKAA